MNPSSINLAIEEIWQGNTSLSHFVLADQLYSERSALPHIVFTQAKDTEVITTFGHVSFNKDEYRFEVYAKSKEEVGDLMNEIFGLYNARRLHLDAGSGGVGLGMVRIGSRGPMSTQLRNQNADYIAYGMVRFRVFTQYGSD